MATCDECGLPIVECNAVAGARRRVEDYLREYGYGGLKAREAATRLIPDTKSQGEG